MDILIAEDNAAILNLYAVTLKNTEHTLILTKNGIEAFEQFEKTGARIVITDWEMPGMNGLDLCRKIRAYGNDKYIYIIFVTSRDQKGDAVAGFDAGADDYIQKPFQAEELIARIRAGERIIQLEDRLRSTYEKLFRAEKMASVGRLAAGIAHEINNPVSFISGNLEVMVEYHNDQQEFMDQWNNFYRSLKKIDNVSNDVLSMVEKVKSTEEEKDLGFLMTDVPDLLQDSMVGIKRIAELVNDMRSFAHPGEVAVKTVDLNNEIQAVLKIVKQDISFKESLSIDFGDIPEIECDPSQLNQVFYDLLANAAYATREKGKVRISTKSDQKNIIIMVSDTGTGIKNDVLPMLFDPFFTTKDVGEGKGMGLNVAYNTVKRHGGRIDVKSDYGKGSVFTVFLPVDNSTF